MNFKISINGDSSQLHALFRNQEGPGLQLCCCGRILEGDDIACSLSVDSIYVLGR